MKIRSIKKIDPACYIATWQSIYKMPPEWFAQFGVVVVDEAHLATAKSLVGIMEKAPDIRYRFGFTGTIEEDSKTAKLTLEGLFGPVRKLVTTREMIDGGQAATTKIKAIVLDHRPEVKQAYKENLKILKKKDGDNKTKMAESYKMEVDYLIGMNSRNKVIRNLVWSLDGMNNLILVTRVEHGKILKEILEREGRIVHLVTGSMSGEDREKLRSQIENDPEKRHDIIGTFGVFSTGVSIKRLDNLIFAFAMKSSIKTLQAIGRLLRKGNGSDDTTIYDIADKLMDGATENYTLAHFMQRCEIYQKEKFKLTIKKLSM